MSREHFDAIRCASEALWLEDFARRHYVLQPPLFKACTAYLGESLATSAGAVLFYKDSSNTFFGFPTLTPGEALVQALSLRESSSTRIEVGAKANKQYDAIFASLHQHIGDDCLPRLLSGAVAFASLEAYVAVYDRRPSTLLQPVLRARLGLLPIPVPTAEEHSRFHEELRQ